LAFLNYILQEKASDANTKFGSKRVNKSCKPRIFIMGYTGEEVVPTIGDLNAEKN